MTQEIAGTQPAQYKRKRAQKWTQKRPKKDPQKPPFDTRLTQGLTQHFGSTAKARIAAPKGITGIIRQNSFTRFFTVFSDYLKPYKSGATKLAEKTGSACPLYPYLLTLKSATL